MSESMIADSAERLFSRNVSKEIHEAFDIGEFPEALWTLVEQAGFPGAMATEEHGGIGIGWLDAYPVLRGVGYWQVPLPLAEHMVAAFVLSAAGQGLIDERVTIAQASTDAPLAFSGAGTSALLQGKLADVAWARHCAYVLISIPAEMGDLAGQLALVDLRQPGVRIDAHSSHAGEPQDTLHFTDAAVRLMLSNPFPLLQRPLQVLGALAYGAMICGALESALEQSVAYAKYRIQFGRPIASYQAIQQQLAQLAGEVASVRTAVLTALDGASSLTGTTAGSLAFDAAVAKVRAGEAATLATSVCHQVHGAIAFTHEHSLHFATRRLWTWRDRHGSDAHWAAQLGELAITAGGDNFWARLTARFA